MKKNNWIALLPIGVFLIMYLGLGIIFEYVLMIPMGFPEENICNVTKIDDGRYEFDVSGTNKAIYEEIAKNLEMSSMEYSEVILITFDNDTIKSYEYRINVVMKHGSESFTIVQTITCTYE